MKVVTIYTDGACSGNPGPGGWGAILRYGPHEKEISGGERSTTNKRMELTAVIRALALLKERSPSCGFGAVYDGTFTGTVVPGNGVAAELLAESGVAVYGESRIQELLDRA